MAKNSFRRHQFVVLAGLSLTLVGIILGTVLPTTWSLITRRVTTQLEAEALHRAAEMEHWLEEASNAALLIASDIADHFSNDGTPLTGDATVDVNQSLADGTERLLVFRDAMDHVKSVSLLEPAGGRVLASTEPMLVSRARDHEDYFISGRRGPYVSPLSYSVGAEAPAIVVAAPVTGADDGLLGVLTLHLSIDDLVDAIGHPIGLEENGRTYLVDRYGFYATMPPGIEGTPLGRMAESEGIAEALSGKIGSGRYVDPQGTEVLGAYRWIPGVEVGMMVEVDWSVVTAEIWRAWTPVIIAGVVLLAVAVVAAGYLANWLVRPLERIGIAARALEGGDLARRAPAGGPDEIGQLADTFNRMASSVQRSHENLERAVSERTQELEELNRELENDIVIRRRAEGALRESEEKYRAIFDEARYGIVLIEAETGLIADCNQEFERQTGRSLAELERMRIWELRPSDQIDAAEKVFLEVQETGSGESQKLSYLRPDGVTTPIEFVAKRIEIGGRQYHQSVTRDITERRRLERQVQKSQLLASLGEMTAGIAHEVNNPLAAILLYSELINRVGLPPAVKKDLAVIRSEAKRASNIMKDLLTYSRKAGPITKRMDIHRTLKKIIGMRRYQERVRNIGTDVRMADGPLRILGNTAQLTQLFMNLIVNAEEALEQSDDKRIVVTTEADGERVRISVADSGTGIPEENLTRVFVPFFSTKPIGKGTGLGLATCHGIVTAHGGLIRAENNDMGGATFIVELTLVK